MAVKLKVLAIGLLLVYRAEAQNSQTPPIELGNQPHISQILGSPFANVYNLGLWHGEATQVLSAERDYVVVMLGKATLADERQGEQPIRQQLEKGQVLYLSGAAHHTLRNLGWRRVHAVIVELTAARGRRQIELDPIAGAKLLFNERRALVYALTIEAHAALKMDSHRELILIALGDEDFGGSGIQSGIPARAGRGVWIGSGSVNFPKNHSRPAQFVIVEPN
ncbi:MAG: hypothetical protein ACJ71N_11845 [Terriglobales bacterium]